VNTPYEKLLSCLAQIRRHTDFAPDIAIVLGSGLGEFAGMVRPVAEIGYAEIEGFPVSTVPGHNGRFVFGYVGDARVAVMQGRVHYYEGYGVSDVVLPVRLLRLMGARVLFLTNAAGGINSAYRAGDFMLIRDHILCFFPNPLAGANIAELGTRFPDMSKVYDAALSDAVRGAAQALGIALREGVYVQLTGPSFETPAEIRMLRAMGADAVGMSTACEAVAARHSGMRVCGISCVSNLAAGHSDKTLTHAEVQETAGRVAPRFRKLIWESLLRIHAQL
jgi:purine-nucleoside phosphorylase